MLSALYYGKHFKFPVISLIFAFSILLVTIPSYLNPIWYEVFGGRASPSYLWQYFTHHLEHGHPFPTELPTLLHLACNLLVILTCGVLSERILGRVRFFGLTLLIILVSLTLPFLNIYGNGASTIAWAYSAVTFYVIHLCFEQEGHRVFKDPAFCLFGLVLVVMWIVITLANYRLGWHNSNILHLLGTVVGSLVTFLWRRDIKDAIVQVKLSQSVPTPLPTWEKSVVFFSGLVPIFLIFVLILASTGVISKHQVEPLVTTITPGNGSSLTVLNGVGGRILIRFQDEMHMHVGSVTSSIGWTGDEPLSFELRWLDTKTLESSLSRMVKDGDKVNLILRRLQYATGQPVLEDIELSYGENLQ